MNVKELRIGNYLLYSDKVVKLTGVNMLSYGVPLIDVTSPPLAKLTPFVTFQPFGYGLYYGSTLLSNVSFLAISQTFPKDINVTVKIITSYRNIYGLFGLMFNL